MFSIEEEREKRDRIQTFTYSYVERCAHLNFDACSSSHKSKLTSYCAHSMSMALSRHSRQCTRLNFTKINVRRAMRSAEFIEMFYEIDFIFRFFFFEAQSVAFDSCAFVLSERELQMEII